MRVTGELNAIPSLTLMRYLLMTMERKLRRKCVLETMTAHTSNSTLVDSAVAQVGETEFLMS
jgi:hypothetical protein